MLLEEAKEILKKNGYRLDEAAGKRITKVAIINGKEVKFVGTQKTVKRRVRGQFVERLVTTCTADIYPNCEWFPQVDFGDKMAPFSCDGYEPETPEFEDVDAAIEEEAKSNELKRMRSNAVFHGNNANLNNHDGSIHRHSKSIEAESLSNDFSKSHIIESSSKKESKK